MKEEILDKIDRYLRKEMTPEETEAFEQEEQKDAVLKEEMELTKDIIDRLKDRQEKLEQMKEWDSHYDEYIEEDTDAKGPKYACAIPAYREEEPATPRPVASGITNRKFVWVAAIGVAACLLIGVFMIRTSYDSAISHNEMDPSMPGSYRGTFSTHEIQALMDQGEYDQSLVLIDSLEKNYRMEVMQYHQKDSLTEEEAYALQTNALAIYELEWLRIQALIANRQYEKAFKLLDKYRMQEGDCQEKADSLWHELKEGNMQ